MICRAVALAVCLMVAAAGCGGAIRDVPPAELTRDQEQLDGRLVRTEGVVRTFDDPRHFWLEDEDLNRVEIMPTESVESLVGARVRVEGRFTFRDDEGRRITVEELIVLDPAP